MIKINEVISRIRGQVKAEVQDAFVTDRYIYSLVTKYGKLLMRRQDFANKLMKYNSIWNFLPYVELIEIDKVEAKCTGIQSGCTIKRTKDKLPDMLDGYWGPLIRTVSSIDSSIELQPTQPGTYASITKTTSFRYNKKKYYWFLNNYLYFPDMEWDAVRVEAVFDDDISIIGSDWKEFDMGSFIYVVEEDLCYLVKSGEDIYKIIFTGTDGSVSGKIVFDIEKLD